MRMNDDHAIDAERIDLIVQLCTRIGMIMEGASPLALDASRDGLEARVADVVHSIRAVAALAEAVKVLLRL